MTLPVTLTGRCTTTFALNSASITSRGALVVAPYDYDLTQFQELDTNDVAKNWYLPRPAKRCVITGVIATADKQVGANEDATVTIFEAATRTTATADKVLLQFVLTQSTVVSLLPLNILVAEGKFVNAKTDNDDVHMNIFGYFIPA